MPSIALAIDSDQAPSQSSLIPLALPYLLRNRLDGNRCENSYWIESQRDPHACAHVTRGVAVTLSHAARGVA